MVQLVLGNKQVLQYAQLQARVKPCRGMAYRSTPTMKSDARRFFVGGNWKANGSKLQTRDLVENFNQGAGNVKGDVEVNVAPPFVYLAQVKDTLTAPWSLGAQNSWVQGNGAYTGETTCEMLKDFGVDYVILGHSERRAYIKEDSSLVGQKGQYARQQGLGVIACVGETLDQREKGQLGIVLDEQLRGLINNIKDFSKVIIAYEPVWAIGTGKVATPQQAQEVHYFIRKYLADHLSAEDSRKLRIIYGGSVSAKNAVELAAQPDIDGFLVGGASLKPQDFLEICSSQSAVKA